MKAGVHWQHAIRIVVTQAVRRRDPARQPLEQRTGPLLQHTSGAGRQNKGACGTYRRGRTEGSKHEARTGELSRQWMTSSVDAINKL